MPRLLDPTLDVVFKLLFTRKDSEGCLLSLLNAVLDPPQPITSLTLLNPEIGKEYLSDKVIRLDVRCRLQDGSLLDVEMQTYHHEAFPERILYYWARLYSDQLREGEGWGKLAPAVSIILTRDDLLRRLGPRQLHRRYALVEVPDEGAMPPTSPPLLTDHLRIHVLDLGAKESHPEPRALHDWVRFFQAEGNLSPEERATMIDDVQRSQELLEFLSREPSAREMAELRFHAEVTRVQLREDALNEGRREGLKEGRLEAQRAILLRLSSRKFGNLPAAALEHLQRADSAELDALEERLLSADSPEDWLLRPPR